ncbi:MAG: PQQ-binding-like beta-propeller repeat protein [Planctomycetaceae bacterium]|nr:PQQ-binding-like beta-propeller repeat protein [Planctomycetaceae bacterium]
MKQAWLVTILVCGAGMWHAGDQLAGSATAGDWPQILGPDRNGIAQQERIAPVWPEAGPRLMWQLPVGSGVAGVAIRQGQVVLFHRVENQEIAQALDLETGQQQWSRAFPATFQPRIMPDNGPLCVPVLLPDHVILHGPTGRLSCLERATGNVRWSVETHADFGADEGYFGAGSTPLVVGNRVILNVGGHRQQAGVVAFDLESGRVLWQTGDWQASYSSPVLARVGDSDLVILESRLETVGLDPASGQVRFSLPFGMRGPTVNGANPVVLDGHLFLTASYGIGSVWARIRADQIEVLRADLKPLASQYTTPIPLEKHLVGIDGRQDGGPVDLVCFEPATGTETWRMKEFGYASLIKAGNHLLIMKTDGELVVSRADSKNFVELWRGKLTEHTCRALPALSNSRFLLRDEQSLKCFDLSGRP